MASILLISSKKDNSRKQDQHAESNQETLELANTEELNGTNKKIVGMGLSCLQPRGGEEGRRRSPQNTVSWRKQTWVELEEMAYVAGAPLG